MQPWAAENFDAMVDKSNHQTPARVKEIVHGFSILDDLTSNARCAFFVMRSMSDVLFLDKSRVESFVKVIVSAVADSYIDQNGLKYLHDEKEKWEVAQSVFLELDKAIKQPGKAFFPKLDGLRKSERLSSIANSLIDINVESEVGNKLLALGTKYAFSMSPAIAIVLVRLLSTNAEISWDWQGFESTVMLSELKQMVVGSQEIIPSQLNKLVLVLRSPVPAAASTKSVSIPMVSRYTVMLNGPMAQYADVVAPYRLAQAKFTKNVTNPRKLNLQTELDKMGVTNSKAHKLQQFVTRVYYTMWETLSEVDAGGPPVLMQRGNTDPRFLCYPYNALSPRMTFADPAVIVGSCNESTGVWTVPKNTFGRGGVLKAFCEERPVFAVFATNGCKFHFDGIPDFAIGPGDVECDGELKLQKVPAGFQSIMKSLLGNVKLRFLFF